MVMAMATAAINILTERIRLQWHQWMVAEMMTTGDGDN
jgi:hypothetical protein